MSEDKDALQEAVEEGREIPALAMALMHRSYQDSTFLQNQLIESFKNDYEKTRAELDIIRNRVTQALVGPWMPTPDYIRGLMYPKQTEIEELVNERRRYGTPADWKDTGLQ
jgi:hypothetical protein